MLLLLNSLFAVPINSQKSSDIVECIVSELTSDQFTQHSPPPKEKNRKMKHILYSIFVLIVTTEAHLPFAARTLPESVPSLNLTILNSLQHDATDILKVSREVLEFNTPDISRSLQFPPPSSQTCTKY